MYKTEIPWELHDERVPAQTVPREFTINIIVLTALSVDNRYINSVTYGLHLLNHMDVRKVQQIHLTSIFV